MFISGLPSHCQVASQRHLHNCNHRRRSFPYTCLAMLTDGPLTIDRREGKSPDTKVFSLNGPLTLRNLFEFQSELRSATPTPLTVIDLSGVPYMDSAGMGLVMNHYVHCQTRGTRMVVAGANSRVLDLFKVTKVDSVLPLVASLEEAENPS
jgi:anti-sigma B factor antagonist